MSLTPEQKQEWIRLLKASDLMWGEAHVGFMKRLRAELKEMGDGEE